MVRKGTFFTVALLLVSFGATDSSFARKHRLKGAFRSSDAQKVLRSAKLYRDLGNKAPATFKLLEVNSKRGASRLVATPSGLSVQIKSKGGSWTEAARLKLDEKAPAVQSVLSKYFRGSGSVAGKAALKRALQPEAIKPEPTRKPTIVKRQQPLSEQQALQELTNLESQVHGVAKQWFTEVLARATHPEAKVTFRGNAVHIYEKDGTSTHFSSENGRFRFTRNAQTAKGGKETTYLQHADGSHRVLNGTNARQRRQARNATLTKLAAQRAIPLAAPAPIKRQDNEAVARRFAELKKLKVSQGDGGVLLLANFRTVMDNPRAKLEVKGKVLHATIDGMRFTLQHRKGSMFFRAESKGRTVEHIVNKRGDYTYSVDGKIQGRVPANARR